MSRQRSTPTTMTINTVSASKEVYSIPGDVSWSTEVDWRKVEDPDLLEATDNSLDNDEDLPASEYVKSLLGVDPDALFADDDDDEPTDNKYNPNQPRDSRGRFGSGGGGGGGGGGASVKELKFVGNPPNPDAVDTFDAHRDSSGEFTPERKKLHEKIIKEPFEGKTPAKEDQPIAYVMGGGPAAGKSSIDPNLTRIRENTVKIDSDEIKKGIPEYQKGTKKKDKGAAALAHEESSYLSKEIQGKASKEGYNTLLDGTGNSSIESLEKKINKMKAAKQKVVAHYVTADTNSAVARAKERAEKTGRQVPEDVIRDTHKSVSQVFPEAVKRGLFDEATLWDTNGPKGAKATVVATVRGTELTVHDSKAWSRFLAKGDE